MALPLKQNEVDKMWKLFCEGNSIHAIARICHVSHTTVLKYKRRGLWDDRKENIIIRAYKKADDEQISQLAKNIKAVQDISDKLYEQIKKSKKNNISKTPVADFERMVRLSEFLQGRPDSRPQIDFSQLSEEQLTIEVKAMIMDLMQIPECKQELQKLLNSGIE